MNTEWILEELIKTVYALSQPADVQREIIGPPIPGEEMLVDFFDFYKKRDALVRDELLTTEQVNILNKVETKLEDLGSRPDSDRLLLDPTSLDSDREWEVLRGLAADALRCLGIDQERAYPETEVEVREGYTYYRWKLRHDKGESDAGDHDLRD